MPGNAEAVVPQVFINCPFDVEYEQRRDMLILSCVACGFLPSSAIVKGGGGKLRIDRIIKQLRTARYSIHDLSRTKGEGEFSHARFNMPLELGMAIYRTQLDESEHDWLALVPDAAYQLYVSDLAGFDPEIYDGTCVQLIYKVVSFLSVQDEATPRVGPKLVRDAMPAFDDEKQRARRVWAGNPPPWRVLVEAARRALLPSSPPTLSAVTDAPRGI